MNDQDAQELLDHMLPIIEQSYLDFLADPLQPFINEDTALARTTFYKTMLVVMAEDPIEDDEEGEQEVLEKKITEMLEHHQKILDQQIKNYLAQ